MISVPRLLPFSQAPPGGAVESEPVAIAGLADGDAQALFGFVRRLGLNDAQADDAVQETQVRLLAEYRRGITIANPRAWAFRSIYRLAMDEYRLRRRRCGELGSKRPDGHGENRDSPALGPKMLNHNGATAASWRVRRSGRTGPPPTSDG